MTTSTAYAEVTSSRNSAPYWFRIQRSAQINAHVPPFFSWRSAASKKATYRSARPAHRRIGVAVIRGDFFGNILETDIRRIADDEIRFHIRCIEKIISRPDPRARKTSPLTHCSDRASSGCLRPDSARVQRFHRRARRQSMHSGSPKGAAQACGTNPPAVQSWGRERLRLPLLARRQRHPRDLLLIYSLQGPTAALQPIVWCRRRLWILARRAERRAAVPIVATAFHAVIATLSGSAPLGPRSSLIVFHADGIWQSECLQRSSTTRSMSENTSVGSRRTAFTKMYDLHILGWHSFQQLCLTITREVFGQTVESFLDSSDAGKDGAFAGTWDALQGRGAQRVASSFSANSRVRAIKP